jgi:dipeptidyl aminopeptidase/acylaminoacyl peptidase
MTNQPGTRRRTDRARSAIGLSLAAVVVAVSGPSPCNAQTQAQSPGVAASGSPDRGAFVVRSGADTVIVDRFERTADALKGSVSIKDAARVDYEVSLASGDMVRTLHIRQYRWAAAPGESPSADVLVTLRGDSAFIRAGGTTTPLGTREGAIPSFNNAFAISELFTRRARAAGGSGDYWYLALPGGTTLPLSVRPIGTDSMLLTIAGQQQHYRVDGTGRIIGGTIVGQPVTITRASADEAAQITFGNPASTPAAKPDYSAPAGAPYTAEEVSFNGPGGIILGGTLTRPRNARGALPAVVTITGSGQEDRDEYIPLVGGVRLFREVADTLSRVGIAVLRLDDRGLGASTGSFGNSTSADFADDIRAALTWLRSRSDIDPDRLAVLGHSEGGMIAPMVAATDPRLRAMVIMAGPGEPMKDIMLSQNKWTLDHTPSLSQSQRDSILATVPGKLAQISTPALKYWMSYDIAPAAKQVKAATLILQGAADRQVPVENANKLAALIRSGGNRDVTVWIFPATDHLFLADSTGDFLDMYRHVKSNRIRPEILGTLAAWLADKLGVKLTP